MRLIDADALKERTSQMIVPNWVRTLVRTLIDDNATIDAVPVVRCGECKYDGRCMFQSFVIDNSRDEIPYDRNTFYCVDGERKDGESDARTD